MNLLLLFAKDSTEQYSWSKKVRVMADYKDYCTTQEKLV